MQDIENQLDDLLSSVAVLGGAGKMGSGIALLLLREMTRVHLEKNSKMTLLLIDIEERQFSAVKSYLQKEQLKFAEQNINLLRKLYEKKENLVSNKEIIDDYVEVSLGIVNYSVDINAIRSSHLVFEAIVEDPETKAKLLRQVMSKTEISPYFFTNTSSIPISILDEAAGLEGRIIGFHFYNPPAVQKLIEIIPNTRTDKNLIVIAEELAIRLKKEVVVAGDIAGFIGNGHMLREIKEALEQLDIFLVNFSFPQAVYMVNTVFEEWLLRPMGIFQLIDYVGLDVVVHIANIMKTQLKEASLNFPLLTNLVQKGVKGGYLPNGEQAPGFFKYKQGKIIAIYDLTTGEYVPIDETWKSPLGKKSFENYSWKFLQKQKDKKKLMQSYIHHLQNEQTTGAKLSIYFNNHSKDIMNQLVERGVALKLADVEKVLENGFYHLPQ